ncbi:hypothetical protein EDC01DRAFT_634649 [Geopyxis carbonaria]|nr:hypothetical protein EDC01DRAFT_634649 [Geopyxis carbonaria]
MQWRQLAMASMAMAVGGAVADHSTSTVTVDGVASTVTHSEAASSTASASEGVQTHVIEVGAPIGAHAFKPELTTAKVGDLITFLMQPVNHSVVWMDKDSPCVPWNLSNPGQMYMSPQWSGFFPFQGEEKSNPTLRPYKLRTFNITIQDEKPIWFYCSAPGSCIDYNMVGAINANSTSDLAETKLLAAKADFVLSPGEEIPSESTTTPSPSAAASSSSSSSSLSPGAIAGIVIGAIGAFALVGLLFFFVGRRKKSAAAAEAAAAPAAAAQPPVAEEPPMYHQSGMDPRYSQVPGSPHMYKAGHASMMSDAPSAIEERHPHRLSELASQNYDPVEIYTPGLPEHQELPSPTRPLTSAEQEAMHDPRRDTVG